MGSFRRFMSFSFPAIFTLHDRSLDTTTNFKGANCYICIYIGCLQQDRLGNVCCRRFLCVCQRWWDQTLSEKDLHLRKHSNTERRMVLELAGDDLLTFSFVLYIASQEWMSILLETTRHVHNESLGMTRKKMRVRVTLTVQYCYTISRLRQVMIRPCNFSICQMQETQLWNLIDGRFFSVAQCYV